MTRDRFVPIRATRAERRRWDEDDRADAARAMTIRPNVPPRPSKYSTCHDSVYLVHRFVADGQDGRRCAFCRRPEEKCLLP